jgi:hypothetical protein
MALLLSACMIFTSTGTTRAFADDLATNTDAQTTIEESYTEEEVTTEEVVVESTEESVTTEEITEESTTEETTEADSKESEETEEGEVEEPEFITFDHMYSDVEVSGINTKELFVETDNVSVFTKNTTVESNYDNVYIISFESIEEARFAYSYYIDKVNFISDMSNVVTLAEETETSEEDVADMSNVNEGDDSLSNLNDISVKDYSGYIALIDSGVNTADAKLSVLGDDGSDTLGHGTKMYNYIKEENPNAKVVSIKAFDGNKTNIVDVYAAIKLAIESKVSVINMSFVAVNNGDNELLYAITQEAINNGIIVIGAAGNYSSSANNYIPSAVPSVISVGAANEDGTLYSISNYDADLYVVATSTSEAAARYSGIYSSNKESDKVFKELVDTNENDQNDTNDTNDTNDNDTNSSNSNSSSDVILQGYNADKTAAWWNGQDKTTFPQTMVSSVHFIKSGRTIADLELVLGEPDYWTRYNKLEVSDWHMSLSTLRNNFASAVSYGALFKGDGTSVSWGTGDHSSKQNGNGYWSCIDASQAYPDVIEYVNGSEYWPQDRKSVV